jgi:hypothetical protein
MKKFEQYLENIEHPTKEDLWDIAGIIKGQNGFFKFNTKSLQKNKEGESGKYLINDKSDKIVFEAKDQWIIVDVEELQKYIKEKKPKKVYLNNIVSELDWNIILKK